METHSNQLNLVLIASGSGTDADSILGAWAKGFIPEITTPLLISTKPGAGCLEKARTYGVQTRVIDYKGHSGPEAFNQTVKEALEGFRTDLVFLVG